GQGQPGGRTGEGRGGERTSAAGAGRGSAGGCGAAATSGGGGAASCSGAAGRTECRRGNPAGRQGGLHHVASLGVWSVWAWVGGGAAASGGGGAASCSGAAGRTECRHGNPAGRRGGLHQFAAVVCGSVVPAGREGAPRGDGSDAAGVDLATISAAPGSAAPRG